MRFAIVKKFTALLIVFPLLFGATFGGFAFASEEDEYEEAMRNRIGQISGLETGGFSESLHEFSDIVGTIYEKPAKFLSIIEVMNGYEDGTFRPENNVTRAETANLMVKMLGLKDADIAAQEPSFSDVSENNLMKDSIETAKKLKIINGYSESVFEPDSYVSYEQVVKMIMCALGYEIQSESSGGYPLGYFVVANRIKILPNIKAAFSDFITRGDLALLVFESMQAKIAERAAYGDDSKISFHDDQTLLERYFNIYKDVDVVKGISSTQYGEKKFAVKKNEVKIGETVYDASIWNTKYSVDNIIDNLLGYRVQYFYETNDDDTPTLIYAEKYRNDNNDITLADEEILKFDKQTLDYKLDEDSSASQYYETAEFAEKPVFIFNGKYEEGYDPENYPLLCGSVKLIDNNNDDLYDVIMVFSYDVLVVGQVFYRDSWELRTRTRLDKVDVADKFDPNKRYSFDADDSSVEHIFYYDNKRVEIAEFELRTDDVLSIMQSLDGELVTVYISTKNVVGVLTEYVVGEKAYIDGIEYTFSKWYKENTTIPKSSIRAGERMVLVINHDDKVVAIIPLSNDYNHYGYLMGHKVKTGLGNPHKFNIFTSWGEMKVYEGVSNIKVNGSQDRTPISTITNLFKSPQVIKFKTNAKLEITEIYTANGGGGDFGLTQSQFVVAPLDGVRFTKQGTNYRIVIRQYSGQSAVTTNDYISSSTLVFVIPTVTDAEEFYEVTSGEYVNYNPNINGPYNITLFDLDETRTARAALITIDPQFAGVTVGNNVFLVESLTSSITEEGDPLKKIYGYTLGYESMISTITPELKSVDPTGKWGNKDVSLGDLKFGDIIQANYNSKGKINGFKLMFRLSQTEYFDKADAEAKTDGAPNYAGWNNELIFGKVKKIDRNMLYIQVSADDSASWREVDISTAKIMGYGKNKIETMWVADIKLDQQIVVRAHNNAVTDAIIYDIYE
ncbi:MAG: S-layer homology domain-containing protein [Firmicutes bacterium]|nr:S-layer homology domain-containing protein [Bacillota bacterium]